MSQIGRIDVRNRPTTATTTAQAQGFGVINMFAQLGPGRPKPRDTVAQREAWFLSCLQEISQLEGLKSIAFPYQVGCGLAGGNWERYERMLTQFADSVAPAVRVVIFRLEIAAVSSGGGGGGGGKSGGRRSGGGGRGKGKRKRSKPGQANIHQFFPPGQK
jgi:hypothetical protein